MINFNGDIQSTISESVLTVQRAAYYGDGLFESIRSFDGRMPFWSQHWERLMKGVEALELEWPELWTSSFMENEVLRVGIANSRIRLMVWRTTGGLYNPENNSVQYLITVQPLQKNRFEWIETGIEACFCHSIQMPIDELSGIKALGGVRYVKAAKECAQKGFQDGFLTNSANRICEASSSNICWVKDGQLFYPPLGEGQVIGTLQTGLLSVISSAGWKANARFCTKDNLLSADEIILTNAIQGIRWVKRLEGVSFDNRISRQLFALFTEHMDQKLNGMVISNRYSE